MLLRQMLRVVRQGHYKKAVVEVSLVWESKVHHRCHQNLELLKTGKRNLFHASSLLDRRDCFLGCYSVSGFFHLSALKMPRASCQGKDT